MLSDKKLEKIYKTLGKDFMKEMEALPVSGLAARILDATSAITQATEELENHEEYQQRKADLATFSKGLSDLKKRQNAIIRYSQHLLEEKGQ